MLLPALYHWSPADRRALIREEGLTPGRPPVTQSASVAFPFACVCLAPTPSMAWSLSGAMEWVSEVPLWDLWMVRLDEGDEVHVRPMFGPKVEEIKVRSPLPPDRLWWVGERPGEG